MKERPILFSTDMVKAVLDDRKTLTRRIVKPQPPKPPSPTGKSVFLRTEILPNGWNNRDPYARVRFWYDWNNTGKHEDDISYGCPYGVVGDRLWAREAFCYAKMCGYDAREDGGEIWYKATDSGQCEGPYKPSIHMFKKHARIWLEITGIRVERVQEITPEDCEKEGLKLTTNPNLLQGKYRRILDDFKNLWDSLNAKRGYGWKKNPWVWVIEFKRVQEKPGKDV